MPVPELENLLATGRFRALVHQLQAWARTNRKTCFQLLVETIRAFLPPCRPGSPSRVKHIPWLRSGFSRRNRFALAGYPKRTKLLGPLPSFQENLATLDALRRQLACMPLQIAPPCERRYPYLDRDLLEFCFRNPARTNHSAGRAPFPDATRACWHRSRGNPQAKTQGIRRPVSDDGRCRRMAGPYQDNPSKHSRSICRHRGIHQNRRQRS